MCASLLYTSSDVVSWENKNTKYDYLFISASVVKRYNSLQDSGSTFHGSFSDLPKEHATPWSTEPGTGGHCRYDTSPSVCGAACRVYMALHRPEGTSSGTEPLLKEEYHHHQQQEQGMEEYGRVPRPSSSPSLLQVRRPGHHRVMWHDFIWWE